MSFPTVLFSRYMLAVACLVLACGKAVAQADAWGSEASDASETSALQAPVQPLPPEPARNRAEQLGWNSKHPATLEGVYFKPGKGLTVESEDGLFKLQTRVRGQFRYELSQADSEEATHVFNLRRARVVFGGHLWGADNTFKMELALSPRDLGMRHAGDDAQVGDVDEPIQNGDFRVSRSPLLDLYVQFNQLRDLNVRIGQYKIPFSRQRVISSGNLMFVDRSIVNSEFTLDRDLGIDLRSRDLFGLDGRLHYYAGLYTGEGHSSFRHHAVSSFSHGFGLNALLRLEYLPFGKFQDYHESDLQRTPLGLSLGATLAHVGNAAGGRGVLGREPADEGTTDYTLVEADAMLKIRGMSLQAEFVFREGKRNLDGNATSPMGSPALEAPRSGWGLTAQAGYLFPINVELAVRHSSVRGSGDTSLNDRNETGFALGYYLAGHPYKIQADYLRLYSDNIDQGAHQFRTQLQVSL